MESLFTPESGKSNLIPKNTLAWAIVTLQEFKVSKEAGGRYANLVFTVLDGPFTGRKIFAMICDPYDQKNSENWRKMAVSAMARAFESAGVFNYQQPDTYKVFANQPFDKIIEALHGRSVAVKIGVKEGQNGMSDQNDISDYLSPNPQSQGHKSYLQLVNPQATGVAPGATGAIGGSEQARAGFLGSAATPVGVMQPNPAAGGFPMPTAPAFPPQAASVPAFPGQASGLPGTTGQPLPPNHPHTWGIGQPAAPAQPAPATQAPVVTPPPVIPAPAPQVAPEAPATIPVPVAGEVPQWAAQGQPGVPQQ